MRIIIKKHSGEKWWSQLFCTGDVACELGGMMSHAVFEKMKSQGLLKEIPATEIIEKYSKPGFTVLFTEIKESSYYEL